MSIYDKANFINMDNNGVIYLCDSSKVVKYDNSNWIAIVNSPIDNIKGFEIIQNSLILYNEKMVATYDGDSQDWNVIKEIPNQIQLIFKDTCFDKIYIICEDGNLFSLSEGGKTFKRVDNLSIPQNENISCIFGDIDEFFLVRLLIRNGL